MSLYGKSRPHEPIPADKLPNLQWVWVIDRCMYSDRGVRGDRYALFKKNKGGGVTVIVRGYARVIPKAESRHFFYDKDEAEKYVRDVLAKERNSVIKREERLAKLMLLETLELLNTVAPPTAHTQPPPFKGKIKL